MDGTENQTDNLQGDTGLPSAGGKGTSKKEAKTYTEDEAKERESNALAAAGRDAKAFEQREAAVKAREDAIKAKDEAQDAIELSEAQGDPDKMAVYQKKQAETQRKTGLDAREAALNKREAEHAGLISAAQTAEMERKIFGIAAKYNEAAIAEGKPPPVDPQLLKDLELPTVEAIEKVAKAMSAGKPPVTPKTPEGEPEPVTAPVDSALTSGGQGEPTQEQLEKMPMAQYAAYVAKRDAKK